VVREPQPLELAGLGLGLDLLRRAGLGDVFLDARQALLELHDALAEAAAHLRQTAAEDEDPNHPQDDERDDADFRDDRMQKSHKLPSSRSNEAGGQTIPMYTIG